MEEQGLMLVLLTCSCLASPTYGPGGKEAPHGVLSETALENEGVGETLRTNEILPPPGHEEQPFYLVHGEGFFQPPSAGTMKLYMPAMQKVMTPPITMADFDFLDQNGNSLIDTTELATGSNLPGFAEHAFKMSDLDHDGFVNLEEFFQFPMTWQRVVAEVRFQEDTHGMMTANIQPSEKIHEPEGMGKTTPFDSQTERNSTKAGVTGREDQFSTNETVVDISGVAGEREGETENEGQLVGTTGLAHQGIEEGEMPAEKERKASASARSDVMTSSLMGNGQVDVPTSQTDGDMQEVVEEEVGKQETSLGMIQDTQVAGKKFGEVGTTYSAGETKRYQTPSPKDVGPSKGDGIEYQTQVGTKESGVRPQGYHESPYKASYDNAYPVKSISGYIYPPYIKAPKPDIKGYFSSIQRSRIGDSSEEDHGGGSSSDEDEEDRK